MAIAVKNVGNLMNLGAAPNAAAAGKTGDDAFAAVWDSRTGKSDLSPKQGQQTPGQQDKAGGTEKAAKPADQLRAKDADRNMIRTKEKGMPADQQPAELSEEELDEAMEVVATAVVELITQIADTFQIPVEEVQDLMQQMDLKPMDLLQPQNLGNLLLEAAGAQDSLALLTDEQLYADFQTLMDQGKKIVEQGSENLRVSPEELMQTLETQVEVQKPSQPQIEITVKKDEALEDDSEDVSIRQRADAISAPVQSDENLKETAGQETDASGDRQQKKKEPSEHNAADKLVMPAIRNEEFRMQAENVREPSGVWDADTQDIMRQIMDYMRIQIKPDMSSLEMQLHPASLGTLQIQVASKGGVLTANFVTQNETVKAVLESQMVQLKESFAQQGVKVEAIEVTVQTHQFDENLDQGRDSHSQETQNKKGRSRRVSLDTAGLSDDGLEAEENRQTAQTMAAKGSTVEYTA